MKRTLGFTLIEMLVVLSLIVILATLVAPGMSRLVAKSRQTDEVNALLRALHIGQTEAIKRNATVSVCARDAPDPGSQTCGPDWENGCMVFEETVNVDGEYDAGEPLIAVCEPATPGTTLRSAQFIRSIQFQPDGFVAQAGTFIHCDARGPAAARAVNVSRSGRARVGDRDFNGQALTCPAP
jgi:type IV fimbrial biogenesis protein FimT